MFSCSVFTACLQIFRYSVFTPCLQIFRYSVFTACLACRYLDIQCLLHACRCFHVQRLLLACRYLDVQCLLHADVYMFSGCNVHEHDCLLYWTNILVAYRYLNKAPYGIAITVSDQSIVNMKQVLAMLFVACFLFKAGEAAPSTNYHQVTLEDKWVPA